MPGESVTVKPVYRRDKSDTWEKASLLPKPEVCSQMLCASALGIPGWVCLLYLEEDKMVHFVGAGPGAEDLITQRGAKLLGEADQVIYAGSLVNPELLKLCRAECRILDSARMTLEEVIEAIIDAEKTAQVTVRLHTGDPSLYGTIREQTDRLTELGIAYDITPGVSSFSAAAAALGAEYTLPGVSQTLILTRMAGRTPVPESEEISALSTHGSSMAVFLSAGMLPELQRELLKGAYREDTPVAIIYKVSWPDERRISCTVGTLSQEGKKAGIHRTALILVGDFLRGDYERSRLYAPDFETGYRERKDME